VATQHAQLSGNPSLAPFSGPAYTFAQQGIFAVHIPTLMPLAQCARKTPVTSTSESLAKLWRHKKDQRSPHCITQAQCKDATSPTSLRGKAAEHQLLASAEQLHCQHVPTGWARLMWLAKALCEALSGAQSAQLCMHHSVAYPCTEPLCQSVQQTGSKTVTPLPPTKEM
jgi:hypothetical protein